MTGATNLHYQIINSMKQSPISESNSMLGLWRNSAFYGAEGSLLHSQETANGYYVLMQSNAIKTLHPESNIILPSICRHSKWSPLQFPPRFYNHNSVHVTFRTHYTCSAHLNFLHLIILIFDEYKLWSALSMLFLHFTAYIQIFS